MPQARFRVSIPLKPHPPSSPSSTFSSHTHSAARVSGGENPRCNRCIASAVTIICLAAVKKGAELSFISGRGPHPGRQGHGDGRETTVTGSVGTCWLWGLAKGREKQWDRTWALMADEEACQQTSLQVSELKMWCTRKHRSSFVFCMNIKLCINNVLPKLHFIISNTLVCTMRHRITARSAWKRTSCFTKRGTSQRRWKIFLETAWTVQLACFHLLEFKPYY